MIRLDIGIERHDSIKQLMLDIFDEYNNDDHDNADHKTTIQRLRDMTKQGDDY